MLRDMWSSDRGLRLAATRVLLLLVHHNARNQHLAVNAGLASLAMSVTEPVPRAKSTLGGAVAPDVIRIISVGSIFRRQFGHVCRESGVQPSTQLLRDFLQSLVPRLASPATPAVKRRKKKRRARRGRAAAPPAYWCMAPCESSEGDAIVTADSVVVSAPCVTTDNAAWIHSVPDPCDVVLGFFAVGAGAIDARVRVASAGARAGAAAARGAEALATQAQCRQPAPSTGGAGASALVDTGGRQAASPGSRRSLGNKPKPLEATPRVAYRPATPGRSRQPQELRRPTSSGRQHPPLTPTRRVRPRSATVRGRAARGTRTSHVPSPALEFEANRRAKAAEAQHLQVRQLLVKTVTQLQRSLRLVEKKMVELRDMAPIGAHRGGGSHRRHSFHSGRQLTSEHAPRRPVTAFLQPVPPDPAFQSAVLSDAVDSRSVPRGDPECESGEAAANAKLASPTVHDSALGSTSSRPRKQPQRRPCGTSALDEAVLSAYKQRPQARAAKSSPGTRDTGSVAESHSGRLLRPMKHDELLSMLEERACQLRNQLQQRASDLAGIDPSLAPVDTGVLPVLEQEIAHDRAARAERMRNVVAQNKARIEEERLAKQRIVEAQLAERRHTTRAKQAASEERKRRAAAARAARARARRRAKAAQAYEQTLRRQEYERHEAQRGQRATCGMDAAAADKAAAARARHAAAKQRRQLWEQREALRLEAERSHVLAAARQPPPGPKERVLRASAYAALVQERNSGVGLSQTKGAGEANTALQVVAQDNNAKSSVRQSRQSRGRQTARVYGVGSAASHSRRRDHERSGEDSFHVTSEMLSKIEERFGHVDRRLAVTMARHLFSRG